MTKIFSAVFLAICLIGSWVLIKNRPPVSYETHVDMQATLVQVITQHLKKEKPNAKEFAILELKSQILSTTAVRVYFQYQFEEPDINGAWVKTLRSGAAELMKAASQEANAPEKWQVREGRIITKEGLVFEDALRIVPGTAPGADEVFNDVPTAAPHQVPAPTPAPTPTGTTGHPAATGGPVAPPPHAAPSPEMPGH